MYVSTHVVYTAVFIAYCIERQREEIWTTGNTCSFISPPKLPNQWFFKNVLFPQPLPKNPFIIFKKNMIIKNALRLKCIILISSVLGGLWLGFGLIFAGIDLWLDPYKPNFKTAVRLIRNNHKIKTEIIKKYKFFSTVRN